MKKRFSTITLVTVVILAMAVTFSVTMLIAMRLFDHTVANVREKESMYTKLAEIDRYVRDNDYYAINDETLYDAIAAGYMLGTGDRYARYYTAQAYTELLNIQNGQLMGIGVELGRDQTGYARVTKVYSGSPAEELGMVAGCYITAVDEVDLRNVSSVDAMQNLLRGEAGTTVSIRWLDTAMAERTDVLTRYRYTASTVDYQITAGSVGYIRIRQFDSLTPSELDYAIRTLTGAGAQGLVFDLRDNPGGVLDQALRCISLICPDGIIGYSMDKNGNQSALGSSAGDQVDLPMVCLVNENTASAAELFAAALRNMSGARLVGVSTAGKGTIQSSPQRLSDGSAVVVTVAAMLDSNGQSFDGAGLAVDVERALTSEEQAIRLDYTVETDPQILRAVSTVQSLMGAQGTQQPAAGSEAASEAASAAAGEAGESQAASQAGADAEDAGSQAESQAASTAGSEAAGSVAQSAAAQ